MNKKELEKIEDLLFDKYLNFTFNTDTVKEASYNTILNLIKCLDIKINQITIDKILKYNNHNDIINFLANKYNIANFRIQDLMYRNDQKLKSDIKNNRVDQNLLYIVNDYLYKHILIDEFTYNYNNTWLDKYINN